LLIVAGEVVAESATAPPGTQAVRVCSLVERFGRARAMADPAGCVEEVVAAELATR